MKSLFLFLSMTLLSAASQGSSFLASFKSLAHPPAEEMISVPLHAYPTITQGPGQCEVMALFNSFLLGTPNWHHAVQSLPGETMEDKYISFLKTYAFKPTEDYPDRSLLRTTEQGTSPGDLRYIAIEFQVAHTKDFSNLLIGKHYIRKSGVEFMGQFSARVFQEFQKSIRDGFPIVAVLAAYHKESQATGTRYHKMYRHAVTVVGISKEMTNHEFNLEYIDPEDGELHLAHVFEGKESFAATYRETSQPSSQKAIGLLPNDPSQKQMTVNSPMLMVRAPDLQTTDEPVSYTLLEFAMGHLPPE